MTVPARKTHEDGSVSELTIDVFSIDEDRPFVSPEIGEFQYALNNALNDHSIDAALEFNSAKQKIEKLLKASGMTFADLVRVRELDQCEMPYIANAPYPRRHFHVQTRDGHTSLVQVGGFFSPGLVFCKTHGSCEPCECSNRVRLSNILNNERSLKLVEDAE